MAGGVETVADLAGLDYQDLGRYDLPREVRDKLGRVVSVRERRGGMEVGAAFLAPLWIFIFVGMLLLYESCMEK